MAHPSPRDVCPRASGCLFPAPPRPASAAVLGLLQYAPAAATPAAAPALYPPDAYVAVPSTSRDPPSWRRCCDACGPRVHGRGRYCVSGRIRGTPLAFHRTYATAARPLLFFFSVDWCPVSSSVSSPYNFLSWRPLFPAACRRFAAPAHPPPWHSRSLGRGWLLRRRQAVPPPSPAVGRCS